LRVSAPKRLPRLVRIQRHGCKPACWSGREQPPIQCEPAPHGMEIQSVMPGWPAVFNSSAAIGRCASNCATWSGSPALSAGACTGRLSPIWAVLPESCCAWYAWNSLWVMFARDLGVSPARFRARQKAGAAGPAQPSEHSRTAAVPGSHHCDAMLPVSHGSSWVDPVQQPSPHNGRRFGPHHLASRHRGAVPDISRGLNPQSG
jgi:hypothetical protein